MSLSYFMESWHCDLRSTRRVYLGREIICHFLFSKVTIFKTLPGRNGVACKQKLFVIDRCVHKVPHVHSTHTWCDIVGFEDILSKLIPSSSCRANETTKGKPILPALYLELPGLLKSDSELRLRLKNQTHGLGQKYS